ncbi:phosphatase PAP2 family protein, partial [Oleiphilus sp. HI0043]|uniref:phosphatase PAP2 family protein n=4 Tax=Oleiphilus TaxID=141450 RepID=UPI000B17E30D
DVYKGCAPLDQYSFPSGHTMHAACFSTVVLWHLPEFAVLLVPFSILIALSRMVLGLHYPTDVLCGAGLGILLASIANYLSPVLF